MLRTCMGTGVREGKATAGQSLGHCASTGPWGPEVAHTAILSDVVPRPGHRCRSRAARVCPAGREPPQAGSGDPCGLNSKSAWPQGQEPTYHAAGLCCGKRNSQKVKRLCQTPVAGRQLCIKTSSFEISPGGHISSRTQVQLLLIAHCPQSMSEAEMCSQRRSYLPVWPALPAAGPAAAALGPSCTLKAIYRAD